MACRIGRGPLRSGRERESPGKSPPPGRKTGESPLEKGPPLGQREGKPRAEALLRQREGKPRTEALLRQREGESPGQRPSDQTERGSSPEKALRTGRGERHSRRAEKRERDLAPTAEGHALPAGKAAGFPVFAGRGAWGQTLTITKPCEWPQMGQTFQGSLPEASWPQWAHLNTVSFSLRYRVPELSRS